jgi:arginine-tRNA-protein transferase
MPSGRIGFRRSQGVAYRPSCLDCSACVSVRVVTQEFCPSATQRKMLRRHADLEVTACKPWTTGEQYALLRRYLKTRHPGGGMVDMDESDFADMVEQSPVKTYVVEYREPSVDGRPGRLIGACLTDQQADGLSMIYSFFEPDLPTARALAPTSSSITSSAPPRRPALCLSRLLGREFAAHGLQGQVPPAGASQPGRLAPFEPDQKELALGR